MSVSPSILYIEDRPDYRESTAQRLQEAGARVLVASNADEALERFMKSASVVSAIVTDLQLSESDQGDRSGIELSNKIHSISPMLPRFAITAHASSAKETTWSGVYQKEFDPRDRKLKSFLKLVVTEATKFDENRYSDLPEELLKLKGKYGITNSDFSRLLMGARIQDVGKIALLNLHDLQLKSQFDPDELAVPKHREIYIAASGTLVEGMPLLTDVATVIVRSEGVWIAELFGFPLIFAYADSEQEAVANLLEHLLECYAQISGKSDFENERHLVDIVRFQEFLLQIFGEMNQAASTDEQT